MRDGFLVHLYKLSKENDRKIAALDAEIDEGAQAGEMRDACSPPLAGWLILFDNDWSRCEVDHVRVVADDELLPGATPVPRHGFNQICPGRHLVRTPLPSGTAILDTLVYPGKMHAFALDLEAAAWAPIEEDDMAALVEAIDEGTVGLHHYFNRVATPRLATGLARPRDTVLDAVGGAFAALVARLDRGENPARLAPEVARLGGALVGLPLPSFERVAKPIGTLAWQRASAGRRDLARLVTQMGLALLPGEPSLLASLAGLLAEDGAFHEALALAAQARPHADATWTAWLDDFEARAPRG